VRATSPTFRPWRRRLPFLLFAVFAGACGNRAADTVTVATTSSAYDTGLLDALANEYRSTRPGRRLVPLVVGTGEALALGRRGDADLLIVHAVELEQRFMAEGHGELRLTVFSNDYVIAGPPSDPAGVRAATDAADAMRRIEAAGAPFASRGDDSGTHHAERALRAAAGIAAAAGSVIETGLGMGETLAVADERRAYVLTDHATLRMFSDRMDLDVLFSGGAALHNPYSVILVQGARNAAGARDLAVWLAGREAAAVVAQYGVERFGTPLFRPVVQDTP
jgi:tungstate transport system substrate-binding protein